MKVRLTAFVIAMLVVASGSEASSWKKEVTKLMPVWALEKGHWWIVGPFEWTKEGRTFWGDRPLAPDAGFDAQATYEGKDGPVKWREVPQWDEDGRVYDIWDGNQPDGVNAAYLYRAVGSPVETDAILYFGFDDGLVLKLNGETIFERFFYRGTEPRQEAIRIHLKKGRNEFLLKIVDKDNTSSSGFCFEIRPAEAPAVQIRALELLIAKRVDGLDVMAAQLRLAHLYRQVGDLRKADAVVRQLAAVPEATPEQKAAARDYFETRPSGIGLVISCRTEGGRAEFRTTMGTLYVGYWRDTAPRITFVPAGAEWPYPESRRPLPVSFDIANKGGRPVITESADRYSVGSRVRVEVLKDGSGVIFVCGAKRRFLELGMRQSFKKLEWGELRTYEGPWAQVVMHLDTMEGVFGMGNRYDGFNRRGRVNAIGNCDRAFGESHFTLPYFVTEGQDALFLNSFGDGEIAVDMPNAENMAVCRIEEGVIDFFYFVGKPKELVRQYVDLTGHPVMPPDWTLGVWMSRNSYEDENVVLDVAKKLREHKIPADVLVLEAWREDGDDWMKWNTERWPNHEQMCKTLHEMGFKIVIWTMQFHVYNLANPLEYEKEAFDKHYFVMEGEYPWGYDANLPKNSYIVDFFNPEACEWWERQYGPLFDSVTGIDGLKTDIGENNGGKTSQGWTRINNIYALGYIRTAWEMTKRITGEGMVFARTGTVGTQAYPILWAGDHSSWFQGMQEAFSAMMSAGLAGYAWTSFDIGGLYGDLDKETYVRMAQMGAFCPIMQCHGQGLREPYHFGDFGEEAVDIFNRYAGWYMALKDYRKMAGQEACRTGVPIMRPLWMEFPDDKECYRAEHQYFFGSDILVAPIFSYNHTRNVYLPKGRWVDWWTGQEIVGKRYIRVTSPLEQMPLYVKAGSPVLRISPGGQSGKAKNCTAGGMERSNSAVCSE